ncbi:MAG: NAD(+)/NADH kinase [Planctomycetota bacterium]|jgi:NAD+ kinase
MKKVAIIGDGKKAVIREAVEAFRAWLSARAEIVLLDLDEASDLAALKADLVMVFGGDGFLLSIARRLGGNPVPVMGVNFGKLGFIAEYAYEEIQEAVTRVLAGTFRVSRRTMMKVQRRGEAGKSFLALNDAVVARGDNPRMIFIEMTLDGERELNYAGDGLIISTPTGSTAHSLAAGGPILTPEMEGMVLTPICAQALTTRPLVIPAGTRLEVKFLSDERGGMLTVDGQNCLALNPGDVLDVEAIPGAFHLIRDVDRGFLDILQEKLSWGVLPQYQRRFRAPEMRGSETSDDGPEDAPNRDGKEEGS